MRATKRLVRPRAPGQRCLAPTGLWQRNSAFPPPAQQGGAPRNKYSNLFVLLTLLRPDSCWYLPLAREARGPADAAHADGHRTRWKREPGGTNVRHPFRAVGEPSPRSPVRGTLRGLLPATTHPERSPASPPPRSLLLGLGLNFTLLKTAGSLWIACFAPSKHLT